MRLFPAVVSALAAALLTSPGVHAGECKRVNTRIDTTFFMDGCTSPVGLCTAGEVKSGPLKGTTVFVVLTTAEGATPADIAYTGELVITTKTGVVTIRDAGVLNGATGEFVELEKVVHGTKAFHEAKGILTSRGTMTAPPTAPGFTGTLKGLLCGVEFYPDGQPDRSAERSDSHNGTHEDESDSDRVDPEDSGS